MICTANANRDDDRFPFDPVDLPHIPGALGMLTDMSTSTFALGSTSHDRPAAAVASEFSRPQILVDMDGVCADFFSAAASIHGIAPSRLQETWPRGQFFLKHDDLAESRFKRPSDHDPLMDVINRRGGHDFWERLEPTPWFKDMYAGLQERGNVEILTTPSEDPASLTGKLSWLERNAFPKPSKIHFSSHKDRYAHPGAILVDDGDHNVRGFTRKGGNSVLVPQIWNSAHEKHIAPERMASYILAQVDAIADRLG